MAIDIKELKTYIHQRFKNSKSRPLRSYYKDTDLQEKMEKALESNSF